MFLQPRPLGVFRLSETDPLESVRAAAPESTQLWYLRRYLDDLEATWGVEESHYFDRDFLAEFSAYYSTSARHYPNVCRRLNFFGGDPLTKEEFVARVGTETGRAGLQDNYLGFVVIRPLEQTPLGRTVLRWYRDKHSLLPRTTTPKRTYRVHLLGECFTVDGLAWQQQDAAVGSCSTVALWSLLHSSAFDDHHAVPTTAQITQMAATRGFTGRRVFPSPGLQLEQLCEVIRGSGLAPVVCEGDRDREFKPQNRTFSRNHFSSLLASLVRSDFPVLLLGSYEGETELHTTCAVGFREASRDALSAGANKLLLIDQDIKLLYAHDDNIGPNVRLRIDARDDDSVILVPDSPSRNGASKTRSEPPQALRSFIPSLMIAALPEEIRVSPESLQERAANVSAHFCVRVNERLRANSKPDSGLSYSVTLMTLPEYLQSLAPNVRLRIHEQAPPMSRYLAVLRLLWPNGTNALDILYDTTDCFPRVHSFCSVVFDDNFAPILADLQHGAPAYFDKSPLVSGLPA